MTKGIIKKFGRIVELTFEISVKSEVVRNYLKEDNELKRKLHDSVKSLEKGQKSVIEQDDIFDKLMAADKLADEIISILDEILEKVK